MRLYHASALSLPKTLFHYFSLLYPCISQDLSCDTALINSLKGTFKHFLPRAYGHKTDKASFICFTFIRRRIISYGFTPAEEDCSFPFRQFSKTKDPKSIYLSTKGYLLCNTLQKNRNSSLSLLGHDSPANSKFINKNYSAGTIRRSFHFIYCFTSFFHNFIGSLHLFFCVIHDCEEVGIANRQFPPKLSVGVICIFFLLVLLVCLGLL